MGSNRTCLVVCKHDGDQHSFGADGSADIFRIQEATAIHGKNG